MNRTKVILLWYLYLLTDKNGSSHIEINLADLKELVFFVQRQTGNLDVRTDYGCLSNMNDTNEY